MLDNGLDNSNLMQPFNLFNTSELLRLLETKWRAIENDTKSIQGENKYYI